MTRSKRSTNSPSSLSICSNISGCSRKLAQNGANFPSKNCHSFRPYIASNLDQMGLSSEPHLRNLGNLSLGGSVGGAFRRFTNVGFAGTGLGVSNESESLGRMRKPRQMMSNRSKFHAGRNARRHSSVLAATWGNHSSSLSGVDRDELVDLELYCEINGISKKDEAANDESENDSGDDADLRLKDRFRPGNPLARLFDLQETDQCEISQHDQ